MLEDNKMRCPYCQKCVGVFISSDNENSVTEIYKTQPILQVNKKQQIFEVQCPRCKKVFYINMGYKD